MAVEPSKTSFSILIGKEAVIGEGGALVAHDGKTLQDKISIGTIDGYKIGHHWVRETRWDDGTYS